MNRWNSSSVPLWTQSSLIAIFESVRILTCILSILGLCGNLAIIVIIAKTSFRHVSYGLLIIIIALFDSVRLISGIYRYLLFANIIRMNIFNYMIYLALDRYPIFIVNWCKVREEERMTKIISEKKTDVSLYSQVFMSFERILTIRYWEHHTHLDWRSKHKRKQYDRFILMILLLLFFAFLIEHPMYLYQHYRSVHINYQYLIIENEFNENYFYLSYFHFNEELFQIISDLVFHRTLPIISILILNYFLFREMKKLPLSLQIKVKESIGILLFLTALSILMIPRAFLAFYYNSTLEQERTANLYQIFSLFYICLAFEYFNHAITGYTCFLSSALLRSELKNLIWNRFISHHFH